MAEKYQRIKKDQEPLPEHEIRVKSGPGIGKYLKRAVELLKNEAHDTVVIRGVSKAIENAVKLAELVKHRVKGLYQVSKIENITLVDEYEPLEKGLDPLRMERRGTMLTIELSKKQLDRSEIGYQDPIPESEVQEYEERERGDRPFAGGERGARRGGRGGLRGGFRGRARGGFRGDRGDRGDRRGESYGRGDRREGYDREYDRPQRARSQGRRQYEGGEGRPQRRPRDDYEHEDDYYRPPRQNRYGDRSDNRERSEPRPYRGGNTRGGPRGAYRGGYNNRYDREEGGEYRGRGGRGGFRGGDREGGDRPFRGGDRSFRGGDRPYRGGDDRPFRGGNRGGDRPYRGRGDRGGYDQRREDY